MASDELPIGAPILLESFPPVKLYNGILVPLREECADRVATELQVMGLEGATWTQITAREARGTWDIVFYLAPESLPIILPGYLQWILNYDEADVMRMGLPQFLTNVLSTKRNFFSLGQLESMAILFSTMLGDILARFDDEEIEAVTAALQTVTRVLASVRNSP